MRAKLALLFLAGSSLFLAANDAQPTLINGRPAEPGEFTEVVYLTIGSSKCTGTLVGERVLMTAAHCGTTGSVAKFQVGQTLYQATLTRSSLYPGKDHDIALGLVDKKIEAVKFASVGGKAEVGKPITLAGYGCISPDNGGSGGNDGILRVGESEIKSFTTYDMVSSKAGGAALCFGDSGGPAFMMEGTKHLILGINSKGNIKDTNYNTRTDLDESKAFFLDWATKNNAQICGVQVQCGSDPDDPDDPDVPPPLGCKERFQSLGECLGYIGKYF